AGLSYTFSNGSQPQPFNVRFPFTVTNPDFTTSLVFTPVPVTIRDYQRASVNLAGGFGWYPFQPADCPGNHLRFRADVGGRYGASRLELNDLSFAPNTILYRRLYDVYGAVFLALHSDYEIQVNACTWFVAGVRAEWNYNWSDILHDAVPHQGSNLMDVNLMLT